MELTDGWMDGCGEQGEWGLTYDDDGATLKAASVGRLLRRRRRIARQIQCIALLQPQASGITTTASTTSLSLSLLYLRRASSRSSTLAILSYWPSLPSFLWLALLYNKQQQYTVVLQEGK